MKQHSDFVYQTLTTIWGHSFRFHHTTSKYISGRRDAHKAPPPTYKKKHVVFHYLQYNIINICLVSVLETLKTCLVSGDFRPQVASLLHLFYAK